MKNLAIINFLKGYSIFTIVVFHYLQYLSLPSPLDRLISFGGTGVHLFVLLSGFGLYLSYLRKPIGYGSFLKKRFTKIYVPYVIVVLLAAFLSLGFDFYGNSLYALGGHLFLYKMFDESIVGSYGYQLWFISMIIQYYLLFYVLVRIFKSMTKTAFLVLALAISFLWATIVHYLGYGGLRIWNSFFLQFLWEFALGMILAKTVFQNSDFKPVLKKNAYLVIGLVACVAYMSMALFWEGVGNLFNDIPALIGYSFIAIWIYLWNIKKVNGFFLFTGNISYSVYLLHFLCLEMTRYFLGNMGKPVVVVLSLVMTYLTSIYFQKFSGRVVAYLLQNANPKNKISVADPFKS
ncbi:MAG: acyltransferase [Bacteroidota bacterium]